MALASVSEMPNKAKEAAKRNFSMPVFVSVIAAGAALSLTIYGLRKVGMKKAAAVVSKAK